MQRRKEHIENACKIALGDTLLQECLSHHRIVTVSLSVKEVEALKFEQRRAGMAILEEQIQEQEDTRQHLLTLQKQACCAFLLPLTPALHDS